MKRYITTLALALAVIATAGAKKVFKLQGILASEIGDADCLIFIADEECRFPEEPTETLTVKKGKFAYSVKLDSPRSGRLVVTKGDEFKRQYIITIVPGETAKMTVNQRNVEIDGTEFYKQEKAFDDFYSKQLEAIQQIMKDFNASSDEEAKGELRQKFNACREEAERQLDEYLCDHADEEGAIIAAINVRGGVRNNYDKASETVKNGRFSKYFASLLAEEKVRAEVREAAEKAAKEAEKKSAEGEMFVDFEAEYNGKVYKLSDYVGRGKYVLVDFWASWCGPCRAEIPVIKEVYSKYKGDNFEVLGVATWDKPEDTLRAIEELGIEYPQMMNAQKAGSDAYGIQGIPQIILFGPDGEVLKRNLRGENIEKEVSERLAVASN